MIYLLAGIALTWTLHMAFYKWSDRIKFFSKPPFNCDFCISFWVASCLIIWFLDPIFVTLPLLYYVTLKLITKI